MKKVYIYIAAICLAAMTSCIKEDPFEIKTAYLDVSIDTRSAESQQEQGDGIKDVMLWAFKCTINPETNVVSGIHETASGWRRIYDLDTYQSFTAHVQLPMCNTDNDVENEKQSYVLVAVINKDKFGTIYDRTKRNTDGSYKTLTLDGGTTYNQLINASFDASAQEYWNQTVGGTQKKVVDGVEIEEETPVYMPVSHWTTFTISETNTHPGTCKEVNMPVYRTVAKSQFLMAKKGANASFDLKVISLKLINNDMPTDGMVLSSVENVTSATQPAWFNSQTPTIPSENAAVTYTLVDATTEATAANAVAVSKSLENHPAPANGDTVTQDFLNANYESYNLIGSHFIYETTGRCEYKDNVTTAPTGDGYYYEVIYEVDGNEYTRCVGINSQIVRNHDYQVRALVDAGGKLSLSLVVNEWKDVAQGWDYIDVATLAENGKLKWNDATTVGDLQTKNKLDDEGNPVVDYYYRNVTTTEAKTNNQIEITKCATCTFNIQTPTGGTWYAMFANGDINSFEFVDENGTSLGNTASGNVGSQATLRIRATKSASEINRAQQALLDVVVKTADGRTIKVNGLMVDSNDSSKTIKYQMVQNKN